jgi:hypothetical protein
MLRNECSLLGGVNRPGRISHAGNY